MITALKIYGTLVLLTCSFFILLYLRKQNSSNIKFVLKSSIFAAAILAVIALLWRG